MACMEYPTTCPTRSDGKVQLLGKILQVLNTGSVGGGGAGTDVAGPASATDNAIARFDGTTGKIIQNSAVTISDGGEVGIGIAPSSYKLHVKSNSDLQMFLDAVSGQQYTSLLYGNNGTPKFTTYWDQSATMFNFGALAGGIVFATAGGATVRAAIAATGNVGIGPSITPSANLDVNNSTTPTKIVAYETTDGLASPSNYSRLSFATAAGNHQIRTEAAGTGLTAGMPRILQIGSGPSVGSDIAGQSLILHSGQPTGNGLPGPILFQMGLPVGVTGSSVTPFATVWSISAAGALTAAEAMNMAFGTATGTKIGTATGQKLSFWNKAPIIQPTTGISAAAFTANTSLIANDTATFGGYTLGQIAAALINVGILA